MQERRLTTGAKRILVAGGAGFIGSNLCEHLLALGHNVTCVDNLLTGRRENLRAHVGNSRFRFIDADICDPLNIEGPIDEVYNLACAASPPSYQADPVHTMMTCVQGTLNLLQLAERHGARFLQASTSEIYGDPEEHPQREDYVGHVNCTGPRACYDEGKRAAETLCYDMLRSGRVDVRVARIFNTYGPRMRPDDGRIVSNLIVQTLKGEALTIYGSGEQTRAFCYVTDLVRGLVELMTVAETPDGPINLGNPGEFTVNRLASLILSQLGVSRPVRHCPLPVDDPRRRRPDIDRAQELLAWTPVVPLEDGLKPTIQWFRQTLAAGASLERASPPQFVVAAARIAAQGAT